MKLFYKGENILNVPNLLSLYRLLVFPAIMVFIITHNERFYIILLFVSFLTDILDGLIARKFHLVTKFGAALDNLADFGTYILAISGLLIFKWNDIKPHSWILWLFFSIFILSNLISWIRFGKMPGLHLISCVLAGYLQGLFFILLFIFNFYA